MANVHENSNYVISKVSTWANDCINYYTVDLQRLPTSTYVNKTSMTFRMYNAGGTFGESTAPASGEIKLPPGLSKDDFVANVLPLINTEFAVDDAVSYTNKEWN